MELRNLYKHKNDTDVEFRKIKEPEFVFLTSFMTPVFKAHLKGLKVD